MIKKTKFVIYQLLIFTINMGIVAAPNFTQPEIGIGYSGDGRQMRQIVSSLMGASTIIQVQTSSVGAQGQKGWSPVLQLVSSSGKSLLRVVDYVGGAGSKPTIPTDNYIGASGLTNLAGAIDIRGAAGANGSNGANGATGSTGATGVGILNVTYDTGTEQMTIILTNSVEILVAFPSPTALAGWSPVYAIETSGDEAYIKIVDYTGGDGTAPAMPAEVYLGASGFTVIGNAINIKLAGPAGASGTNGTNGTNGWGSVVTVLTTENLDEVLTHGLYFCSDFSTLSSTPGDIGSSFGFIDNFIAGMNICQTIRSSGGKMYMRFSSDSGGSFSAWLSSTFA